MSTTEQNLAEAFSGESQANRKYLAFAKQAERMVIHRLQSFSEQRRQLKLSMPMPI